MFSRVIYANWPLRAMGARLLSLDGAISPVLSLPGTRTDRFQNTMQRYEGCLSKHKDSPLKISDRRIAGQDNRTSQGNNRSPVGTWSNLLHHCVARQNCQSNALILHASLFLGIPLLTSLGARYYPHVIFRSWKPTSLTPRSKRGPSHQKKTSSL